AEERRAGRVEHVHAHVVAVRPNTQVRVVEEVGAEVKVVAMIRAGRVTRSRDSHALIGRHGNTCELCNHPAIGELVVHHYRIATAVEFTDTTEAAPDGRDA